MTTWIWDASALNPAATADRVDVLLDIARCLPNGPSRSVTTALVVAELTPTRLWPRCASHLEVVDLSSIDELVALTQWLAVVSSGTRSRGEATVFAWAEVNGGLVIIDDGDARKAGCANGLAIHGTLWVSAEAIKAGTLSAASADTLVATLRAAGARYPTFPAGRIEAWARQERLL